MGTHNFCRFSLKELRKDLKKNKIKIPKICSLGVYFTIGREHIEVSGDECRYSKRCDAILEYLKRKKISFEIQEIMNKYDESTRFLNAIGGKEQLIICSKNE